MQSWNHRRMHRGEVFAHADVDLAPHKQPSQEGRGMRRAVVMLQSSHSDGLTHKAQLELRWRTDQLTATRTRSSHAAPACYLFTSKLITATLPVLAFSLPCPPSRVAIALHARRLTLVGAPVAEFLPDGSGAVANRPSDRFQRVHGPHQPQRVDAVSLKRRSLRSPSMAQEVRD